MDKKPVRDQKAGRITKTKAHRVWKELDDGKTPEAIEIAGITSERSAVRLKAVKIGFENKDLPDDIAAKTGWKVKQIEKLKPWLDEYVRSKHLSEYRKHINQLLDLAEKIRKRIINPKIEQQALTGNTTWDYGGVNWRSSPSGWSMVVTPYLESENVWGDLFPHLKSHLERSPFMQHYNEFTHEIDILHREFSKIIAVLKMTDENLFVDWLSFKDSRTDMLIAQPLDEIISSDKFEYTEDEYKLDTEVQKIFNDNIPALEKRYHELEIKLQMLWDDLDKYKIRDIIESGKCPQCQYAGSPAKKK